MIGDDVEGVKENHQHVRGKAAYHDSIKKVGVEALVSSLELVRVALVNLTRDVGGEVALPRIQAIHHTQAREPELDIVQFLIFVG